MENSRNTQKIKIIDKAFLSFLGAGLVPFAPGTFGTIAAIPVAYVLSLFCSQIEFLAIALVLTVLFSFYLESARKQYGLKDPGWVVIDEVIGYLVAVAFLPTPSTLNLLIAAALFRVFDIFKIWPASFFDKKVKHGCGIILDDIIAGIYAGAICWILDFFKIIS